MEHHLQVNSKKNWTMPQLVVYGTVQKITQCEKVYGESDGHTFGQVSIVCAS
jgi:hypothetical protein